MRAAHVALLWITFFEARLHGTLAVLRSATVKQVFVGKSPSYGASSQYSRLGLRQSQLFSSSSGPESWTSAAKERDESWLTDSNYIEYVLGGSGSKSFGSLESIGLNISSELSSRNIIPHHLTTASDLFCNRELNMESIDAVGFDMDWTLAQYNIEFDLLAFNGATEKLVNWLGYPEEVLKFAYSPDQCRRGCIIDKKRGNVLKLDQHNYVRVAEHGLTPLSSDERKAVYRQKYHEMQAFGGSNFATIDTPFSLVDAALFTQLVDLRDRFVRASEKDPTCAMAFSSVCDKSYLQLWSDMRRCVDRCHKDGVIKTKVAEAPEKYITYDPNSTSSSFFLAAAAKATFLTYPPSFFSPQYFQCLASSDKPARKFSC